MNTFLAASLKFGLITKNDADAFDAAISAGTLDPGFIQAITEQSMADAFKNGLIAQSERLFKFLAQNQTPSSAQWDAFWKQEDAALLVSVQPTITQTAQQSAIFASVKLADDGWKVVNEKVAEWVDTYYNSPTEFGSIPNLNLTSRQQVAEAFNAWQRGELAHNLGLPSLALELQPTFGEKRAKTIAITETTRIYSEAERQTTIADPDIVYLRWMTGADERVCSICGPLHGRIVGKGEKGVSHPGGAFMGFPPAHVNCRCRIVEETAKSAMIPLRDNFNPNLPPPPAKPAKAPKPAPAPVSPPPPPPPAPTSPSLTGDVVQFGKTPQTGLQINNIPLQSAPPSDWNAIQDKKIKAPKLPPLNGKTQSAGVLVVEDDGRVWVVEPSGHYGGYNHTFAKGRVDGTSTLQQTAMREAFEEMGIKVDIVDYLTDAEGSTTMTRYFVAKRTGGAPWDAHWETDNVKLATVDELKKLLNVKRDQDTLDKFVKWQEKQAQPAQPPKPRKPRTPKAAATTPAAVPVASTPFPTAPDGLIVERRLGGSTGAELVKDPATGLRYVRKRGSSQAHLREEVYADGAYRAMGVNVPEYRLYETDGGPVKLSAFIENTQELGAIRTSDPARYERIRRKVQSDFAADALMGNWDVGGAGYDNILVDANDTPWRIDNGGSFRYRAQGGQKTAAQFGNYVDEVWTLRNPDRFNILNPIAKSLYSDIDFDSMAAQMVKVGKAEKAVMDALADAPDSLKATVKARFKHIADLGEASTGLRNGKMSVNYAESFIDDMTKMTKAGLFDNLPAKITFQGGDQRYGDIVMYDAKGKPFDDLRGPGGLVDKWEKYVASVGGNASIAPEYLGEQAGSSWSDAAKSFKHWLFQQSDLSANDFFWQNGFDSSKTQYEYATKRYGATAYDTTMRSYHILNYRMLMDAEMPSYLKKGSTLRIYRSESDDVMRLYGMSSVKKGTSTTKMIRGAAESGSLVRPTYVMGQELTVQDVPIHMTFANWMFSRTGKINSSALLGDGENEIVFMFIPGSKATYLGHRVYPKD